jgi:hypothetical protein
VGVDQLMPSLCFALLCFALLCFALLCFALLCFACTCHLMIYYTLARPGRNCRGSKRSHSATSNIVIAFLRACSPHLLLSFCYCCCCVPACLFP